MTMRILCGPLAGGVVWLLVWRACGATRQAWWPGLGTARRLKLAMAGGLESGRSSRVPRASVSVVWSRRRKTRTPGWTSLAERSAKPPVCWRSSNLRGGSGGERDGGKSAAERGVAPVVEGGEPAVEEAAGGGVGDEAGLLAEAGQVNDDEGVDVADVVAVAGGGGGVGGVAEDNGVDFVFVVFIVGGRGGGGSRGGAGSAGAGGAGVLPAVVTQGVDDGGEGEDGGHGGEQDGFGADGLGAGEIEAGSGGSGGAGWEGMLHR